MARMPGWESECRESKTACRKLTGTTGLGVPDDISQMSDTSVKGRGVAFRMRDVVDDCNLCRSGSFC